MVFVAEKKEGVNGVNGVNKVCKLNARLVRMLKEGVNEGGK